MHLLGSLVASLCVLAGEGSEPAKKHFVRPEKANAVKLVTSDRAHLKADLLHPNNRTKEYPRSGAVILIHGQKGERGQLWALQRKITDWGAVTLTIDLRAKDESPSLSSPQEDIKSAIAYLRKQKGIDPSRISLLGVDLGAAAALRVATADLSIKGVGFVSPETEIPGFDLKAEAKKLSPRSLFLLAPLSSKDMVEALANDLATGMKVVPIVTNGEAKGAALLEIGTTTEPKVTTDMGLKFWLGEQGVLTPGP